MITDPLADSPELLAAARLAGKVLVGTARGRSYHLGGRSGPQWALDGCESATRYAVRFTAAGCGIGLRLSLSLQVSP